MGVAERRQTEAPGECEIMKKRGLLIFLTLVAGVAAAGYATRSSWMDAGGAAKAQAQGPARGGRTVAVQVANAQRKSIPVEVDAIGTVSPIASVALKSRIETTITEVHFEDGARVNAGDILFVLDGRQIDAQIAQAEGTLVRDRSQLAGAERDFKRYSELIGKGATTQLNVDNAQTQMDALRGTVRANELQLDNLKVQKSYTVIRAPISGRISAANVKVGNFVRPADVAPLATINQIAPIYVTLGVPQRVLAGFARRLQDRRRQRRRLDAGRQEQRDRQGRDDREHRRRRNRHGDGARDHGQRQRDAVAGHAGLERS